MINKARDEWSFQTHLIGMILASLGTIYMAVTQVGGGAGRWITLFVFGLSMIALYTCSSVYHYSKGSKEHIKRLRKLDHAMIFVLIAGTYTPILYNGVSAPKNYIFLGVIWGLAVAGIVLKMFRMKALRWLYTLIYIVMGWSIVFDFNALVSLPGTFLTYLIAGGISYTVGAVFYILKKPNFSKKFGFHELFHVFIMVGTICHFIGIVFYL